MELYKINDSCGDSEGYLQTSALPALVQEYWTKVSTDDYTKEERIEIETNEVYTGTCTIEELIALLVYKGYTDTERIYIKEIDA